MNRGFYFIALVLVASVAECASAGAEKSASHPEALPLAGERFQVDGQTAFLIATDAPAEGKPWVWYAPTLGPYPGKEERWMFEQFLSAGISIAGIDVGESYGSPDGRKTYSALHKEMVKRGYSEKPVLLGRSRGGLMTLAWAVENA